MKQEYAALAGHQLTSSHNYLLFGEEIAKVHDHLNITKKPCCHYHQQWFKFRKSFLCVGPCDNENEEATTIIKNENEEATTIIKNENEEATTTINN